MNCLTEVENIFLSLGRFRSLDNDVRWQKFADSLYAAYIFSLCTFVLLFSFLKLFYWHFISLFPINKIKKQKLCVTIVCIAIFLAFTMICPVILLFHNILVWWRFFCTRLNWSAIWYIVFLWDIFLQSQFDQEQLSNINKQQKTFCS